jgi:hypothetical protein
MSLLTKYLSYALRLGNKVTEITPITFYRFR